MPKEIKLGNITAQLARETKHKTGLYCAIWEPTTNRLLVGTTDATILAFDPADYAKPVATWNGHRSWVSHLASAQKRGQVISTSFDRQLICRDASSGESVWTTELPSTPQALALSPDETQIAVANDNVSIDIYSTDTGKPIQSFSDGHPERAPSTKPNSVLALAWSPDGNLLASGTYDGTLVIRETSGKILHTISDGLTIDFVALSESNYGGIRCLMFAADGTLYVSGGGAKGVQGQQAKKNNVYVVAIDPKTGTEKFRKHWNGSPDVHSTYIQSIMPLESGWILAALADPDRMDAIDCTNVEKITDQQFDEKICGRSIVPTPDGKSLIVAGWTKASAHDGVLRIWELKT